MDTAKPSTIKTTPIKIGTYTRSGEAKTTRKIEKTPTITVKIEEKS